MPLALDTHLSEPALLAIASVQSWGVILAWSVITALSPQLEATAFWMHDPTAINVSVMLPAQHLNAAEHLTKQQNPIGRKVLRGYLRLLQGFALSHKSSTDGARVIRHHGVEVYRAVRYHTAGCTLTLVVG